MSTDVAKTSEERCALNLPVLREELRIIHCSDYICPLLKTTSMPARQPLLDTNSPFVAERCFSSLASASSSPSSTTVRLSKTQYRTLLDAPPIPFFSFRLLPPLRTRTPPDLHSFLIGVSLIRRRIEESALSCSGLVDSEGAAYYSIPSQHQEEEVEVKPRERQNDAPIQVRRHVPLPNT